MEILEKAEKLLSKLSLCDNCLGRQFGNLLTGTTNRERGRSIKMGLGFQYNLVLKRNPLDLTSITHLNDLARSGFSPAEEIIKKQKGEFSSQIEACRLCGDLFGEKSLLDLVKLAVEVSKEFEFQTFVVGSLVPADITEREDELRAEFNLEFGESIKSELNRELGKRVQAGLPGAYEVDLKTPDLVFLFDLAERRVIPKPNPLFILGRYRKLKRGIPQSEWTCPSCRGAGCAECDGLGKKYQDSVEELISEPLQDLTGAIDTKFHGGGREDIDARMLGTGRPFVIELSSPKVRFIDLPKATALINKKAKSKIEVTLEEFSSRSKVKEVKSRSGRGSKTYEVTVRLEKEVQSLGGKEKLEELEKYFHELLILQKTPHRVLHRRANKVRQRFVHSLIVKAAKKRQLTLEIYCEGGLYVKELVSGDQGRTEPNIAGFLDTEANTILLDVLAVHSTGENHP